MSRNTQSDEDNADLLEAYFQAALIEGNAENIREFLKIAVRTQDDASFKARLRSSNMELYHAAIKPTMPTSQLNTSEKINNLLEAITSPQFNRNMQRFEICSTLAKKYPDVLKRLRDASEVICVSLNEEVNKWAWKQVKDGFFKDRSEAVEYALTQYVEKAE